MERNPADAEELAAGVPGNIERVNNRFVNLAGNEVRGIDIEAAFERNLGGFGTLNSKLFWTVLESSKYAFNANDPPRELAGTYGYPENRATLDTYFSTDKWEFGLYGRWTDGYRELGGDSDVESHAEWDAQVSNFSIQGTRLTLGVTNLFDAAPPFSAGVFNPQGFNTQYYSMRGRMIYARAIVTF